MTKVLITGATANQSNPVTHLRSTNFAGLIHDALLDSGVEIVWQDASLIGTVELEQFDKVIIGLSSPLALGANRCYASMKLIHELWDDPRLMLFIDAPDPNNITRGLDSVNRNPKSLTKEFFAYRKNYENMSDPVYRMKVFGACESLRNKEWPTVLAPALPWTTPAQIESELPHGAFGKSIPLNLDSLILDTFREESNIDLVREARWMAERGINRKWLKGLAVSYPVFGLKSDHRTNQHPYLIGRLQTATGFLHSPARRGKTWWTPKVAMALSQNTPVFSDWRQSGGYLGDPWAALPGTHEAMSESDQHALGQAQYETYRDAVPNSSQLSDKLLDVLNLEVLV